MQRTDDRDRFLAARDFLLRHRDDYDTAYRDFRWPELTTFNWALDYFDVMAAGNTRTALHVIEDDGSEERISFDAMRRRSTRAAGFLREQGIRRGDRLLLMLGNVPALWELTLAAMKLGAVISPATAQLTTDDLQDRVERGGIRCVVADVPGTDKFEWLGSDVLRISVGAADGWIDYTAAGGAGLELERDPALDRDLALRADDPFLLYFTSGTTARPKMVL